MLLRSWLADWFERSVCRLSRGTLQSQPRRRHRDVHFCTEVLEQRSLLTTIDLASLGVAGVRLNGIDQTDHFGDAVSNVGDVNGDGLDDLFVSAPDGDGPGTTTKDAGESYLIFGRTSWPSMIDLANLGSDGVVIYGVDGLDESGGSISGAGDVNGDGFDDLLIGATGGDGPGVFTFNMGEVYVIFGGVALPATISVANLGTAGVKIFGIEQRDFSGVSVAGAGDVNGDGFDDVLIGASSGDGPNNSRANAGESYVVFGAATLSSTINIGSLGTGGMTIFGVGATDYCGDAVAGAGDVNGDGFDDMLVGALGADGVGDARTSSGEAYIIFGRATLPATIDLATLGTAGVKIFGAEAGDQIGRFLSCAGDVNGDGLGDVLIGGLTGDGLGNAKKDVGESYLIFGTDPLSFPTTIDLANLGSAGTTIFGVDKYDSAARVSDAGDVNGDGFDDLLIGAITVAQQATPNLARVKATSCSVRRHGHRQSIWPIPPLGGSPSTEPKSSNSARWRCRVQGM